ncbi:MAG: CoA pyrophosphatase, partial [Deltaproteobacteria bacterium]|nr:CoA pyrophosphatase [Deltaproteobacteria bacterium]
LLKGAPRLNVPNNEVAEVLWASLNDLWLGNCSTEVEYEWRGRTLHLPAYSVSGHPVWGLTYRIVSSLFECLERGSRRQGA